MNQHANETPTVQQIKLLRFAENHDVDCCINDDQRTITIYLEVVRRNHDGTTDRCRESYEAGDMSELKIILGY